MNFWTNEKPVEKRHEKNETQAQQSKAKNIKDRRVYALMDKEELRLTCAKKLYALHDAEK